MKAVVIVLAIAVAVSANPINRKWEEIGELVQGIRGNVGNAIGEIKKIAIAANPQVGQEISTYLDGKTPEALDILEKVNAEIKAHTLTYKQAEKYFNQLETLLNKVKDELKNFVSQLPENVQVDIINVLDKNIESIREKKNQIFNLLSIKRTVNTPEKWNKIRSLFMEILMDLEKTIGTVHVVANDANSQVGNQIAYYLETKLNELSPIVTKLYDEIEAETLTYNQAVTYFTQFEIFLNEFNDDLINFVFELPQYAQVYIKSRLDKNIESFRENKNQIFNLLTNLPQAFQMEIKTILGDSTKSIKERAHKVFALKY